MTTSLILLSFLLDFLHNYCQTVYYNLMILSLEHILESPESQVFQEFATYLSQSYCIENLTFWLATQEYHKNQQLGKEMIDLYIRPNSPQEINIPCDMRRNILKQNKFEKDLFDEAAEAVIELMRINSFLPWMYQRKKLHSSSSAHALSSTMQSDLVKRRCSSLDYINTHDNRRSTFISLDNNNNSVNSRYKAMLKRVKKTLFFGRPML